MNIGLFFGELDSHTGRALSFLIAILDFRHETQEAGEIQDARYEGISHVEFTSPEADEVRYRRNGRYKLPSK